MIDPLRKKGNPLSLSDERADVALPVVSEDERCGRGGRGLGIFGMDRVGGETFERGWNAMDDGGWSAACIAV